MTECTVVFADPKTDADWEWIRKLPSASALRLLAPADATDAALAALLPEANVLVAQQRPVDAALLTNAPNLRMIQRYGSRPDGIDLAAARERDITIATMPLRGCIAVAELAMTLILSLSKNLVRAHEATVSGAYRDLGVEPIKTEQRRHFFQWMKLQGLQEIYGKTLGIIGFGEIGTETARRARAHGMQVIYNKRTPLAAEIERAENVAYADKDDLLRTADFVLLSTPLTAETENMIGARELDLMKSSAMLVNICRGGVIDETALVAALQENRIAGAGLDVFVYEPIPTITRCWDFQT